MRNLLHGKLRSDLRLKINEAAARREKEVQEGKRTKATKFITGQHQYYYNVELLLLSIVSKISDKTPTAALISIWYGISHVPTRTHMCTEMENIFNKDITKEEFNTVIAIASTNTAPSPTGLTFSMIKKWAEEI